MDKRSETRKDGKASMTIEQMRERKQELGYTYEQIAESFRSSARNGAESIRRCDCIAAL